jgi:hypothetical protein
MADDITHQQIIDRIDKIDSKIDSKIDTSSKHLLNAMTEQLGVITDTMVTKDEFKEELKKFPSKNEVKDIVRDETADIRNEQLRHGVLLEDLDHKVSAIAESVSDGLELKERVNKHDKRIAALESKGKIVISTVTHHSKQIKSLQASKT